MRRVLLHVRVVVVMRVLRMWLLLLLVRLLCSAPGILLEPDELHRGRRARGVGYALDVIHEHGEHLVVDDDLLRNRLHCKARAHVVSVGSQRDDMRVRRSGGGGSPVSSQWQRLSAESGR